MVENIFYCNRYPVNTVKAMRQYRLVLYSRLRRITVHQVEHACNIVSFKIFVRHQYIFIKAPGDEYFFKMLLFKIAGAQYIIDGIGNAIIACMICKMIYL